MITRNKLGRFVKGENLGNQHAKGNKPNKTSFKKGEHRSPETEFKKGEMTEVQLAEKNSNWKGKDAKINPIHRWIEYRKGKAKEHKCEHCGKQAHHWSNIDHKYSRKLEDYTALCSSCHMKFDYKYNNRTKRKI